MSAISTRLANDGTLAWGVFADAVKLVLLDRATLAQARDRVNADIAENTGSPLTAQEEADILAIETVYDAIPDDMGKVSYLIAVGAVAQQLKNGRVPESYFDSQLGL